MGESEFLVSVSRLSLFRRCPLAYKRRYIDKETDPPSDLMLMGKAFHEMAAARETGVDPPLAPVLPAALRGDWEALVQSLDAQTWDDTFLVAVEEPMAITWNDEGTKVRFRAVLDRLEIQGERATIYDRKTGWKVPTQEELLDDLQMGAYAVVVAEYYPQVEVVEVAQLQYRYGGRDVRVAFDRTTIARKRAELIAEVGRMLRTVEFLPAPDCTVCPPSAHVAALQPWQQVTVRFQGPEATEVVVAPPRSLAEAQRVAQGVRLAERLAQQGKLALGQWAEANGPVALGETGAYGYWGGEKRFCIDVQAFEEWLLAKKLPVRKYLRPDGVAVKRLLAEMPEASKFFLIQPQSQFGWRVDAQKAQRKTEQLKEKIEQPLASSRLELLRGGVDEQTTDST